MSGEIIILKPHWEWRVLEMGTADHPRLEIRRVNFNAEGQPRKLEGLLRSPLVSDSGDGLVCILNDLAEALTKPSIIYGDHEWLT